LVLVDNLMKEELAAPFNEPVDWKRLNIPMYPTYVKNPCDLGSIRQMLLSNTLANTEHFAQHVRLVFSNALTFNLEESQIGQFAKRLSALFETRFSEMIERWRKEVAALEGDKPKNEHDQESERERIALQQSVDNLCTQIEKKRAEVNELKRSRGMLLEKRDAMNGSMKKVKLTRPRAPLTMRQKEELVQKIGELEEDDFPSLIRIVDPNASDDQEFTLNFAVLDDITILNIHKYVQECVKAKKKKSGQKRKNNNYGRM